MNNVSQGEGAQAEAPPIIRAMLSDSTNVVDLLRSRAVEDPDRVYCVFGREVVTFEQLNQRSERVADALSGRGVRQGDRVCTLLENHLDHVYVIFGLLKVGAEWVPLNTHLRGPSLSHIWSEAECEAVFYEPEFEDQLKLLCRSHRPALFLRNGATEAHSSVGSLSQILTGDDDSSTRSDSAPVAASAHKTVAISYTSGTTGRPKGVLVTDLMLRACATGVGLVAEPEPGDVFLVWEPLHHVGGSQMLFVPLLWPGSLALVAKFSASKFWRFVKDHRVTHVHYLGGILQILLKQPPAPDEFDNPVKIAWGGGCSAETWQQFERRFNVEIREDFGLTETSSIVTVNLDGQVGSVGKPLPYFDLAILDEDGNPSPNGKLGEIAVCEKISGLLTRGYFKNPSATEELIRDGWLYTGDLGYLDEEGRLYFSGRKTDSVRRRGENVAAWEVETVVNQHPSVEESALVGVPTDVGEEDIKIFVKLRPGAHVEPEDLITWCNKNLAYFQVPRYISLIDEFSKTPTQRIRKEVLPRTTSECWDRETSRAEAKNGLSRGTAVEP